MTDGSLKVVLFSCILRCERNGFKEYRISSFPRHLSWHVSWKHIREEYQVVWDYFHNRRSVRHTTIYNLKVCLYKFLELFFSLSLGFKKFEEFSFCAICTDMHDIFGRKNIHIVKILRFSVDSFCDKYNNFADSTKMRNIWWQILAFAIIEQVIFLH